MNKVTRPGGVELVYEVRGEGPTVMLVNQFVGVTALYTELLSDLVADHRVVTYDPRGTGESTRTGPFDLETDAEDLEAVIEEVGGPVVLMAVSDGCNRAALLAARRPELITAIVCIAGSSLGEILTDSDSLAGSTPVLQAFATLMGSDVRAGVRALLQTGDAQVSDAEASARADTAAAYTTAEAAGSRLQEWIRHFSSPVAREVGDRLHIIVSPGNPWFPLDEAQRTRTALPEAEVIEVEGGPISDATGTAEIIRRVVQAG